VNLYFKRYTYSILIVHVIKMFICMKSHLLKMTARLMHKKILTSKYNKNAMKDLALVAEPF